jgi:kanamycin kinase
MNRQPITLDFSTVPGRFRPYLQDAAIFDSSCSAAARVYYLDKGPGYYLKKAAKGSLRGEAERTAFFSSKGLAAEVLGYESLQEDWLLTRRIPGEDCIHAMYLEDPIRLCDTLAVLLRRLHDTDYSDFPLPDLTAPYLDTAQRNHEAGHFHLNTFCKEHYFQTPEEAWQVVENNGKYLNSDTLLHGDYCLPNIMLDNWKFTGFLDLGSAGIGDRHFDLYWATWSLQFNLKTDRYRDRFFDAYGRDRIDLEMLRLIGAFEVFG